MTETLEPLPIAVVAVIMRNGKTLVIRRPASDNHPGYFGPPMVHLGPDESESAALVSGVRKQMGLIVEPIRKVWDCLSRRGDHELHWWLAKFVSGEAARDEGSYTVASWVLPSAFATLDKAFSNDRKFFLEILPNLPEVSL